MPSNITWFQYIKWTCHASCKEKKYLSFVSIITSDPWVITLSWQGTTSLLQQKKLYVISQHTMIQDTIWPRSWKTSEVLNAIFLPRNLENIGHSDLISGLLGELSKIHLHAEFGISSPYCYDLCPLNRWTTSCNQWFSKKQTKIHKKSDIVGGTTSLLQKLNICQVN